MKETKKSKTFKVSPSICCLIDDICLRNDIPKERFLTSIVSAWRYLEIDDPHFGICPIWDKCKMVSKKVKNDLKEEALAKATMV